MNALPALAQAHGIGLHYHDIWGALHEVSDASLRTLLDAMGVDASTDAQARASLEVHETAQWRRRVAPMIVLREQASPWQVRLHLPARIDASALRMQVVTDAGAEHDVTVPLAAAAGTSVIDGEPWVARDVGLALPLPAGYHRVTFGCAGERVAETICAVTPAQCHRPEALRDGGRTWGFAVQLYSVRSRRNWGIGDYVDLEAIVTACGAAGGGIVGVNPLHALFPHNPLHASPYSPSSRLFANALYLDVEAIADFAECEAAQALVAGPAFQARLATLREQALVDYQGVAAAKREALALLYASFRDRHVALGTARARDFAAWKRDAGEPLRLHALFEALQEHCFANDRSAWGWPVWPEALRDPRSLAVERFASANADRVAYFSYVQWQSDLQRAALAARARGAGLAIGVYTDLAVSIDPGGAEAWASQRLYANGASVGAPPDAFNRDGQDWGLPPIVPSRLRDAAYAPFIATLRANMRHAGALRIDHVMGLMRLFWVPRGGTPGQGAYVHYPLDDLLGLLALESQRHRCLVIGEDLGTVPDAVRQALSASGVLSYRVLMFERDETGGFKPPQAYAREALATPSTHDLPTLAGWWAGHDIDVRASLGLAGTDASAQHEERARDRMHLVAALERAGVLAQQAPGDAPAAPSGEVPADAIAAFLASTPASLLVLQLEDLLLVREQVNLPGTVDTHPNWRRKLPVTLDAIFGSNAFRALARRLCELRASAPRNEE